MADEAIPAATLIVVREISGGPPQLLMVERAEGMAFAAGAWVFPGGRIDKADEQLGTQLGIDGAAVAAVRETVEETAVAVGLSPVPDAAATAMLQRELARDQSFAQLLAANDL